MAWDYKIVQGPKERNLNRIITEEELAKFDSGGWELLTVFSKKGERTASGTQDNERIFYVFRRANK